MSADDLIEFAAAAVGVAMVAIILAGISQHDQVLRDISDMIALVGIGIRSILHLEVEQRAVRKAARSVPNARMFTVEELVEAYERGYRNGQKSEPR